MLTQQNIQSIRAPHTIDPASLAHSDSPISGLSLAQVAELADCDKLRAAARKEKETCRMLTPEARAKLELELKSSLTFLEVSAAKAVGLVHALGLQDAVRVPLEELTVAAATARAGFTPAAGTSTHEESR